VTARHLGWALVLLILLPGTAAGHARSVSYSHWVGGERVATVQVQLRRIDANALHAALSARKGSVPTYLTSALQLRTQRGVCAPDMASVVKLSARTGWVRYEWQTRCSAPPISLRSDLLVDVVSAHIHMTRVNLRGRPQVDYVFTEDERTVSLAAGAGASSSLAVAARYVKLGVHHLLSGWDHIVFLLILVFIATSLREVALAVTGFTIGHSITLGLTVTGYTSPNVGTVEALIGLSIALVAIENVWLSERRSSAALPRATVVGLSACAVAALWIGSLSPLALAGIALFTACYLRLLADATNPVKLRWAIAAMFGLVHGFGFAGAMQQLSPSSEHLALALIGFNVGVELGQLMILAAVWPAVRLLHKRRHAHTWAVQISSAGALAVGLFWFATRL